jgi:hypothetical protein
MVGCNPGPDNPGADAANNMNNPDAGTDADTDSPDSQDPDSAEVFSFDGIESLDPPVVSADAPETVQLALATTGEMPVDAVVEVAVDGEIVEAGDDLSFTPPRRSAAPGMVHVTVTIGETTHRSSLRYAIDPTRLQLDDDRETLALPGAETASAVMTVDSDKDGKLEYLVFDRGGADESMEMLRVYEDTDDGTLDSRGQIDIPPYLHHLDKASPVDFDKDGEDDAISLSFVARSSGPDTGVRLLKTRLHKGALTALDEVHVFEPGDTVLDFMTRDQLDPDTGLFRTSVDAVIVDQQGDDLYLRKRPGRTTFKDPLGLGEYDGQTLLNGGESLALCPDESAQNASSSAAIVGTNVDPDTGRAEVLYAPASDHNASRSNRSSGIIAPAGGDCDDTDAGIKPGLDARITDLTGDGVGDLVVGVGCPGDVDIFVASGSDIRTATGIERRYGGPMRLLADQATPNLVHSVTRTDRGSITGVAYGRCDQDRCEPPFVFDIPGEMFGSGTLDDVRVAAIPPGNPLYETGGDTGSNPLYSRGDDLLLEERFSFKPERIEDAIAPPPNGDGSWWFPVRERLVTTTSSRTEPGAATDLSDIIGAHDVDVAELDGETLVVASMRGPVQLRNADQAKADGGAMLQPTAPRVVLARCVVSDAEGQSQTRSWSQQRCRGGFEVEELSPPDDCVWNGRVSLARGADGRSADVHVGIARERYHKKIVRRHRAGSILGEAEDMGTVTFPGAESSVVSAGSRVFSTNSSGEIVTGQMMGGGALLSEVSLESTGISSGISAELGEDWRIVDATPVPINGSDDYGLILNVAHEPSGPFVVQWKSDLRDSDSGGLAWWGHCNGWTDGVTDETSNGRFEAMLSSFDPTSSSVQHELVIVRGDDLDETDEVFRVRATSGGQLDQGCGEPLLGGTWPDEHICPSTGQRCRGGILDTGDMDGDGYADVVLSTQDGPVLYSNATSESSRRVGPIRWMAPERVYRMSSGAGGQIVPREDGTFSVAPPQYPFLDQIMSPYLP